MSIMQKENFFSKTIIVWLTAALCCALWGSAFPAIKTGYRLLNIVSSDTASILLFAGVRFTLAGILTVLIFSIAERKPLFPRRNAMKKIAVLSVFQTILQYIFFYFGLAYTSGERASVINGTGVFFALFISALLFHLEKLSANKILGSVIGFIGVILVSLDAFRFGGDSFIGEFFVLISGISYAFSSVFMKRYSKDENPAMLSGWQFVLGGAVMMVFGLLLGGSFGNISVKSALLVLYLALVSAVAYSMWSILLKYNPVSKVAVCGFMTPVFGFFLSLLFTDDSGNVGLFGVAALVLVAAGMIIVNYDKKSKTA